MAVKKFARISGKIIVSVGYRLSPEYQFYATLNDVSAVLDWIIKNIDSISGKGQKISVMSDSAEAKLAAVLAIKNRNEGKDQILCQILYYPPATFEEIEFPSRKYFLLDEDRDSLLTEEFVRKSREAYLPDSIELTNPYISSLAADFSKDIPLAIIVNAQVDPLRDDGKKYEEKLREYGNELTRKEYPGLIHGFFNFYLVFRENENSMDKVRDFVNEHIEKEKIFRSHPGLAGIK